VFETNDFNLKAIAIELKSEGIVGISKIAQYKTGEFDGIIKL